MWSAAHFLSILWTQFVASQAMLNVSFGEVAEFFGDVEVVST